jgi:hypothetical protein
MLKLLGVFEVGRDEQGRRLEVPETLNEEISRSRASPQTLTPNP